MVHVSDLSWTKRYGHPSEFTKVGNEIDVVVLELEGATRRMSLGHKQLEENPWDTFANVFPVGSYHEATVMRKDDRGAVMQLPYGLEAYAPIKHLKKENGKTAETDETLTVKVIEFNRDDKRILVSHTRYLEDIKKEADDQVKGEIEKEKVATRQAITKTQMSVEKSTFGDIEGLAEIKEQLKDNQNTEE
jgi:small subunit ribosomal protein S1